MEGVSWKDATKKALEAVGARVEEEPRGLAVTLAGTDAKLLVLVRRLHMSLDRKVEVLGIFELAREHRRASEVLRGMLSSSFEVELKGFVRKAFIWREWRELKRFDPVLDPIARDPSVATSVRESPGLSELLKEASPNLIEVFPEVLPPSFMEAFLVAPGVPLSAYTTSLIREYVEAPGRLAWCYRAQFLYGSPRMPQKIVRNCQLAGVFKRALEEATKRLLQYNVSSPA